MGKIAGSSNNERSEKPKKCSKAISKSPPSSEQQQYQQQQSSSQLKRSYRTRSQILINQSNEATTTSAGVFASTCSSSVLNKNAKAIINPSTLPVFTNVSMPIRYKLDFPTTGISQLTSTTATTTTTTTTTQSISFNQVNNSKCSIDLCSATHREGEVLNSQATSIGGAGQNGCSQTMIKNGEDETITHADFEQFIINLQPSTCMQQSRRTRLRIQKINFSSDLDSMTSIQMYQGGGGGGGAGTGQQQKTTEKQKSSTKKVTKKELQKFQQTDFSAEVEDIFKNLNESIQNYNYKIPSNPSYAKRSSLNQVFHPITSKKRILLVDNIIKLGAYFDFQRAIVHSAIALFDTLFLQPNYQIKEKTLQLFAMTSLFISAKKEDSTKQSLNNYVEFASQYTPQDFINCELSILKQMKWQISPLSLETVNGVVIELLESKYFGCGYMKGNPGFMFRLNVLTDLINLKQNLTNSQFCIKNISLALIFVTITITQRCFKNYEHAQIELTENIFVLGSLNQSSLTSTTFTKINEVFFQFMRKYSHLTSISDLALEVQFIAKFLDFFNDPSVFANTKKNLTIQTDYLNSTEFISQKKLL